MYLIRKLLLMLCWEKVLAKYKELWNQILASFVYNLDAIELLWWRDSAENVSTSHSHCMSTHSNLVNGYLFGVIARVRVVFRKTIVGDWHFEYLRGSHLQSQVFHSIPCHSIPICYLNSKQTLAWECVCDAVPMVFGFMAVFRGTVVHDSCMAAF